MARPSSPRRQWVSATGLFDRNRLRQATSSTKPSSSSRSKPSRSAKRRFSRSWPRSLCKGTVPSVRRGIIRGFQKSVEETRHRILDDVVAALADTKRKFTLGLGKTILRYKAISDQLQGETGGLLLAVTQPSASRCNSHRVEKGQDSLLGPDFLKGHHDIAYREQAALRTYLDDWTKIQSDIIGLVGETGPDHVSSSRHDPTGCRIQIAASDSSKPIDHAWSKRTGTKIEELARGTQMQLAAQEKKWQTDKERRREQMLQLARQMIDCL